MNGILGKKLGMTNIFNEGGGFIPVTLIEAGPCSVLDAKTKDKAGYAAVVLGYGDIKPSKVNNSQKKQFDKLKISPRRVVRELRHDEAMPEVKPGDTVNVSIFKAGDFVDVTGTNIGKGFQGGMKRWNWRGGESGHGSMFHRRVGSVGASSYPSRVHKGKTMPGHMGSRRNTIQNLKVVSVEEEKNLLAVMGSVPGHAGGYLVIRHAKKKPRKTEKKEAKK